MIKFLKVNALLTESEGVVVFHTFLYFLLVGYLVMPARTLRFKARESTEIIVSNFRRFCSSFKTNDKRKVIFKFYLKIFF